MMNKDLISEEITNVIYVLEQVKDVNRMIKVHFDDKDDLMLIQYQYRRDKLLKELGSILEKFEIKPADLAA